MPKRPTIEDIARLAGVSRTTISRVLNHRPDVDRATRERVLRIIEEQGYVPSLTAAGLAGGRNRLLGMLLPVFTWPIIPDLIRGICDVRCQTPYALALYPCHDDEPRPARRAVIARPRARHRPAGRLGPFRGALAPPLPAPRHHP